MCEPATLTAIGSWIGSAFAGGGAAAAGAGTAAAAGAGTAAAAGAATAATAAAGTAAAGLTTAQMISLGLSAAGAGIGAYGAYQTSRSAKDAAEANARAANDAAKGAIERGDKDAAAARRNANQTVGAQRAAFSARGIDISDGTAADLIDQTDFFGQSDAATIRTNARKEAYNYKARAAGLSAQASMENPALSAGTSLLGSAGSVSDKWLRYRGVGVGG